MTNILILFSTIVINFNESHLKKWHNHSNFKHEELPIFARYKCAKHPKHYDAFYQKNQ